MHVQVIHEDENGLKTEFGFRELEHMPPVGEPFLVDERTYYTARSYLGPDERGVYLLILGGEPHLVD